MNPDAWINFFFLKYSFFHSVDDCLFRNFLEPLPFLIKISHHMIWKVNSACFPRNIIELCIYSLLIRFPSTIFRRACLIFRLFLHRLTFLLLGEGDKLAIVETPSLEWLACSSPLRKIIHLSLTWRQYRFQPVPRTTPSGYSTPTENSLFSIVFKALVLVLTPHYCESGSCRKVRRAVTVSAASVGL